MTPWRALDRCSSVASPWAEADRSVQDRFSSCKGMPDHKNTDQGRGNVYFAGPDRDRGGPAPLALHPKPEGGMATKLDKTIKRELDLEGKLYTVAISPEGVKVTPKGARKGHEVSWSTLVGGDTEPRRDVGGGSDAF